MRKIITRLLLGILIITLQSCGNGITKEKYESLVSENKLLKTQIEKKNDEIEVLKFGADKLLNEAKNLNSSKRFKDAKNKLGVLLEKHPASNESVEGKKLLIIVNKEIEKQRLLAERKAKEKIKAEKKRLAQATSKMKKKYDDMNEITWYEDRASGGYTSKLYAYIGKRENSKPFLRFYNRYYADDWLFIESYKFKIDGETYTITEKEYGEIKTNNGSGSIWETLDRRVDSEIFTILKAIANSKSAKIRYNGKDYYKDRTITSSEKRAIRNVFDAYEALGGNMNL